MGADKEEVSGVVSVERSEIEPPEAVDLAIAFADCGRRVSSCSDAGELDVERRNMESIVGRRAAPNGVDKKSAGRSVQYEG